MKPCIYTLQKSFMCVFSPGGKIVKKMKRAETYFFYALKLSLSLYLYY